MARRKSSETSHPSFAHFMPEVADRLESVADNYLASYDEHKAFVYLIAELFETTDDKQFLFTDGAKDGGIDFFVQSSQSYTICQCKCPDLDALPDNPQPPSYDHGVTSELDEGINMLLDDQSDYDVKQEIKRLRGDFQRDKTADPEATTLTAIVAVLGRLTAPAKTAFKARKAALAQQGIALRLIEWTDIYEALHVLDSPDDVNFEIDLHYESREGILSHLDYVYILANAYDFYKAFRAHEWKLFDWNVRYQIPNSPTNKKIVAALMRDKGRKLFHHYNNGLLITCHNYRKNDSDKRLRLKGPQIINGCQTVRAICEAYEKLTPKDQEHFREKTRVQVKVIKTSDQELIGELVISTNDQNPMNPRNLKSNSAEQRNIQKAFRTLPKKWFYQRKDGEMKSLLAVSHHVRWFRKADFEIVPRRYREIDNQDLAKMWYSFLGCSDKTMMGGINYFADEKEGPYEIIFRSLPTPAFWSAFSEPEFSFNPKHFTPGQPSVYQYLLAFGIARHVKHQGVSHIMNRREAIGRGIASGKLSADAATGRCTSSKEMQDKYLTEEDEVYNLNILMTNMKEVIAELCSFVLARKYTGCDAQTCKKLVTGFESHRRYFEEGCPRDILRAEQDGSQILGPIYEFLRDCIGQYRFKYLAEIRAAPRLKTYLARRTTITRLRTLVIERSEKIAGWDVEWKPQGKSFFDSLPDLPE